MTGKILFGLAAFALLMSLPLYRDMHHRGETQTGWRFWWSQFVMKERAKHISSEEAVINAKARNALGIKPSR